jgi:hypothetical protein
MICDNILFFFRSIIASGYELNFLKYLSYFSACHVLARMAFMACRCEISSILKLGFRVSPSLLLSHKSPFS